MVYKVSFSNFFSCKKLSHIYLFWYQNHMHRLAVVLLCITHVVLYAIRLTHILAMFQLRDRQIWTSYFKRAVCALPVNLWVCSVDCSLVTEWGRCWFGPAPLANLQPIRIHQSCHRRTGVERSATACADRSGRLEDRCLDIRELLRPAPRRTAGKGIQPPYHFSVSAGLVICPSSNQFLIVELVRSSSYTEPHPDEC